eukprot:TRINITY_DN14807_c0_g1_i1.p2 TRINITY_DN14807_c0_g1~~TRINITY_DN14807_c0_g1_i1.p2  ORF type:complete len:118 (-),score=31.30 TRINITY_DN14807_c0_g1_i1:19-372(-)
MVILSAPTQQCSTRVYHVHHTFPTLFTVVCPVRPFVAALDAVARLTSVFGRSFEIIVFFSLGGPTGGYKPGVSAHAVPMRDVNAVSYTHLRAHETVLDLVCRLLLEKKKKNKKKKII